MRKQIVIMASLFLTLGLVACGSLQKNSEKAVKGHATLTEQQKLISCQDCHKTATPDVYAQWYESTHSLGGVQCYQCHNTFGNIQVQPEVGQSCNSCHADKVGDKDHTEGLATCWECHGAHSFSADK